VVFDIADAVVDNSVVDSYSDLEFSEDNICYEIDVGVAKVGTTVFRMTVKERKVMEMEREQSWERKSSKLSTTQQVVVVRKLLVMGMEREKTV